MDEVPKDQIPQHMKDYQERTGRKTIRGTKKLLGVMRANEMLLYTLLLKWYLNHGLKVTAIHKYLKYESGKPFSWFPEELSSARLSSVLQKDDEDLMRHIKTTFTTNEGLVDKSFRAHFEDFEEINGAFEIKQHKRRVNIMRPYQCGITVYQLAK